MIVVTCVFFPKEMIDGADRDGDGEVNEHEFLRMMKKTYQWFHLPEATSDSIYRKSAFYDNCYMYKHTPRKL